MMRPLQDLLSYRLPVEIFLISNIKYFHNPSKKGNQCIKSICTLIGENLRYSEFTSTILNALKTSDGKYVLSKGDNVIVSVKNTNQTLAQQLKNFFYTVIGNDTYTIAASHGGMVSATGIN